MQEYVSDAVVLDAYPSGDLDARFSLFTKKFGKLVARAKSVKKITSKLAGHLQAGNVIKVRLVEKKGLQIADALKQSSIPLHPATLWFLDRVLHEAEPDRGLWELLAGGAFEWREALKILGWDPAQAECAGCTAVANPTAGKPAAFHIRTQEFYCALCASKVRRNEVVLF